MKRPYKHTIYQDGPNRLLVLGTYATLDSAIAAAKRAELEWPNETREIRFRHITCRNRYAHGRVQTWTNP
jgi:hypothetical protein